MLTPRPDSPAVAALIEHPEGRRALVARNHPDFATAQAALDLVQQARVHRVRRPDRASRWAMLALEAAARVKGQMGARITALACVEDGNARRLLGEWELSEERFAAAHQALAGLEEGGELLELRIVEASLAIQREEWIRAWDLLQAATVQAERCGDRSAMYRATIKRGIACKERRHYEVAVDLFLAARELAGDERHVRRMECMHNILATYADAGWLEEGLALWGAMEPHYRALEDPHLETRGRWVWGRLLRSLHPGAAAPVLQRVRADLIAENHAWETAEALCDEATAWIAAGEPLRVLELVTVAQAAFGALGLEKRAARAAGLFRLAANLGTVRAICQVRELMRARRTTPPPRSGRT